MSNKDPQTIGKVSLLYEDYPGQDLYSDGDIEDTMLAIAKAQRKDGYAKAIAREKNWPVLYHFSPLRHNLLDFLQDEFRGKDILEIGSGCGAMTGCLLKNANTVECVELSEKRSLINAYRHQNEAGLTIRLGNFQDVEGKLRDDYDVITLIGVFEYASGYIQSAQPFEDFLSTIKKHLKPGGLLLLAIENRLGMKYFAGATEDHCGRMFEGIEGYPNETRAKTFSKPALEKMFREAGFAEQCFYYPFPDYKLPMAVYSDERLPQLGEMRDFVANFDRPRAVLFDEAKALHALCEEGLFPLFANSFLVLLKGATS